MDSLGEDGADDQVGAADPASRQSLAVHPGDEGLDVLTADGADRLAADGGADVGAQHRSVGRDAGVRTEVLVQPGGGRVAEQHPPRCRVDDNVSALVVLDLEREVLGLAQVAAKRLLALPTGPPAGRPVAHHPLMRTTIPLVIRTGAALEDLGHGGYTSRLWSHSSTCRSRNRRYRPTR